MKPFLKVLLIMASIIVLGGLFWVYDRIWPGNDWRECQSITLAKKLHVFIKEYKPLENPYKINKTILFPIKSAWLERDWIVTRLNDTVIAPRSYRLILKVNFKTLESYKSWSIDTGLWAFEGSEPTDDNSTIEKVYYEPPLEDTLRFPIVTRAKLFPTKKIIGSFILITKK